MRDLAKKEQAQLEQLQAGLEAYTQEVMESLGDFIERLGLPEPYMVLRNAEKYLPSIDSWMKEQVVAPEDRVWIITQVGYFIGELLNQRLGGYWLVDTHPDSPYFLQYVVGQFTNAPSLNVRISPFALAANYVDQPPGRDLAGVIVRAEQQIRQCKDEEV